jgi:nitrogen fixation protein NifU and related proteins
VTLRVDVDGKTVVGVSWEGQGCSISQASASVMTELVTGRELDEVAQLDAVFHDLMGSRGKGLDDDDALDALGDATAFTGVSQYPARIKCALLGWVALKDSLVRSGALAS